MKAVQFEEFGDPGVLRLVDLPDPHAGPGQIRVAVRAAGVNPIDWKIRSGMMGGELPQTTGREVAGIVDQIGDRVTDVAIGDRVFGFSADGAGAAELALLTDYAPMQSSLDFVTAAGLPVAVETAGRTLDLVGVTAGETVLINGASGAVGSSAVQLAVHRGARVIGTASESNHVHLRGLGAEPVAYGDGLVDRVRTISPSGVDAAIDTAGGGALPAHVELAGGADRVVTIADYQDAPATGVRFSGGPGTKRALQALPEIGPLIETGAFSLPVAAAFPLAEIARAHTASQTGHVRGKLVLLIN